MARYSRRRYSRTVVRRNRREGFIARDRGIQNLTASNATFTKDLLADYQRIAARDVENCTVTGIRGWMSIEPVGIESTRPDRWFGAGIRTESQRVMSQLDTTGEQAAVGVLDDSAEYDWWQYIYRRPYWFPSEADPSYDPMAQFYWNRQHIRVKSARRLHAPDESLYLFLQTAAAPSGATALQVSWDLSIFCRRP